MIKITGPISGGAHLWAFSSYLGDIAECGYIEKEFFFEGTARDTPWQIRMAAMANGQCKPAGEAPFKMRILVKRPKDPAKFNGTAVVEWANVTIGHELIIADFPVSMICHFGAFLELRDDALQ